VTFSACSATINGGTGSISNTLWQNTAIDMSQNGTVVARASGLSAGGTSFVVSTLDGTPPSTTLNQAPVADSYGWNDTSVTVSLVAADNPGGSGVASTFYTVDGGATQTYTGGFPISTEGAHTLTYYSVDLAGNVESAKNGTVRIDMTPPSTGDDHVATSTGSATIHLTPTDALSGVASTSWTLDGTPGSGTLVTTTVLGNHTLTYASTDKAGNVELPKTLTFAVVAAPISAFEPVYRFRNLKNGYHLWTADPAEKFNIQNTLASTWFYEGVAYQIDTANTDNSSPLWRFRNLKGGFYLYTSDAAEKSNIVATLSSTWILEGVAYNVSRVASGAPVWRFRNLRNGTYLYSADPAEKDNIVANLAKTWLLEGVAYYIAP